MYKPQSVYTEIALKAIEEKLKFGQTNSISQQEVPEELKKKQACFVSLHKSNGDLRGCIGTLEPVEENLYNEIIRNSISSALHDSRFKPLKLKELDDIEISVDVLSVPELYEGDLNWDTQKFGCILKDKIGRRGVLLPNLDGIDSAQHQVEIVKRKAGIYQNGMDGIEIYLFSATRFH